MALTWIILVLIIAAGAFFLLSYNSLVRKRNQTQEAWSDIDVQLKRRYDLIPNLVQVVKGYAQHERDAFDAVTKARAAAVGANSPQEKADAQQSLSSTLRTLFAVAEAYPELKANTNFLELQRELSDTENKIQAAHRFYNSTVLEYNTALQTVPSNFIASLFSFTPAEFFELKEDAARTAPQIDVTARAD